MAEADLRNMIMNFRVSDLQVLLGFAGRNKTGKKQELQMRALDLVKLKSPAVEMKIKELHNRRYHQQFHNLRPNNYDISERTLTDRSLPNYDSSMNNNYAMRCSSNTNVRPMSMNQGPAVAPYSGKPYLVPAPPQQAPPTFADVRFKDLPFFDTLHVIMRPFILAANQVSPLENRVQESYQSFTLSPQEAHDLAVSKDASGNYECQLLLRFCVMDPGTEQDDNFPQNITVKVNGKPVPLPNPIPTNRPGVEPKRPSKPVNITQFTRLSPTVTNQIAITWSATYGRAYAAGVYVARLLTSFTLLQRLKSRGIRSPEYTKAMIVEKLVQEQDSEIATTDLQASLMCPLGKLKMELPCRSLTCSHIQCFDASLYIQLNEKKPKWRCPVCDKQALFKTLVLDGLFVDIVSQVPQECTDVTFHDDGSWTPIIPKDTKESKKVVEAKKKDSLNESVCIVDVSSDSDTEDVWKANKTINISNDDDDDESPPVMFIAPDINMLTQCATPPVTSVFSPAQPGFVADYASSSSSQPVLEPIPMCLTTNEQTEMQVPDNLNSLPDIVSQVDAALPSTSNCAMPMSTYTPYGNLPELAHYMAANDPKNFQTQNSNGQDERNSPPYKNFDFFSLLSSSLPESEHQKYESLQRELAEKEPTEPEDIISLD